MRNTGETEALVRKLRNPETYKQAQIALIEIGAPAVPALIKALGDEESSLAVTEVLREIGAAAVEPLIAALGSENKRVSAYAAIVLEDIGLPAVEALIGTLTSKDQRTLILAVRALGHIGDKRAVGLLSGLLDEPARFDKDGILLEATIESLRKLGYIIDESEVEALQAAVKTRRSSKSQRFFMEFVEDLTNKGFEPSSRSDHIYYHAHIPDVRFVLLQRVIRLERRSDRWELARSFSIARETHLALEALDDVIKRLP